MRDEAERPIGVVVVLQDVTRLRVADDLKKLVAQYAEAQILDRTQALRQRAKKGSIVSV
jgi:hypothetical protein